MFTYTPVGDRVRVALELEIEEGGQEIKLELAIIENVQRSDRNAIEEASGYNELMDRFNYTQERLAEVIGKSRSHVANTLRLLKLPAVIRDMLVDGSLSAGHARPLVTAAIELLGAELKDVRLAADADF